jgi:hypothetical protein
VPRRAHTATASTSPAALAARNAAPGPACSTTYPLIDWPAASPSVTAVSTQPNASAAVPAGATTSIAAEWAVDCGVINAPASSIISARPHSEDGHASRATSAPNPPSSAGSRWPSRRGHGRRL